MLLRKGREGCIRCRVRTRSAFARRRKSWRDKCHYAGLSSRPICVYGRFEKLRPLGNSFGGRGPKSARRSAGHTLSHVFNGLDGGRDRD
jgi:hypothetical protein